MIRHSTGRRNIPRPPTHLPIPTIALLPILANDAPRPFCQECHLLAHYAFLGPWDTPPTLLNSIKASAGPYWHHQRQQSSKAMNEWETRYCPVHLYSWGSPGFLYDIILIFSPMSDIISSIVKTTRRHARNHSADQWAVAWGGGGGGGGGQSQFWPAHSTGHCWADLLVSALNILQACSSSQDRPSIMSNVNSKVIQQ